MSNFSVGTYKTSQHFAVIGEPARFYTWIRDADKQSLARGKASNWIIGKADLYNKLNAAYKNGNPDFIRRIKVVFKEYSNEPNIS